MLFLNIGVIIILCIFAFLWRKNMKHNVKRLVSLALTTAVTVCSLAINGNAASTTTITSVNFTNDGTYLSSIYAGCTTVHVDAGIDQRGNVKFFRNGTELEAGTRVATGDTIKLYRNNSVRQTLSIVVSGDVTCDGTVSAADLLYTQMAVLGINSLEGAPLMAAKISGGASLSATDLVTMRQYVLGIGTPTVMDGFYNSDGYINAVPVYVGTPAFERYDNSAADIIFARNPWDMQTYNGKVYIGSGDYNSNKAPSLIACYDPKTDEATVYQDLLDDEQVSNFAIINGRLIAAGIDPSNNAILHYFELNADETAFINYAMPYDWRVHNFDMIGFGDKIFIGAGTDSQKNRTAALVSTDGGKTFGSVNVVKDGMNVTGANIGSGWDRIYQYLTLNGDLYCYEVHVGDSSYDGFYKYDADANQFNFHSAGSGFVSTGNKFFNIFKESMEFAGKSVICTGYFLTSTDMKTFTKNTFAGSNASYLDMVVIGDELYVLAATENSGSYTNTVYKTKDLSTFTKVLEFDAETYMISMEYVDGTFVFGAGAPSNTTSPSTMCGDIFRVRVDF